MSTFVVFAAAAPAPGLDPLPITAVLTDADDALAAVEATVERGVFASGELYVCDLSRVEGYTVEVNPTVRRHEIERELLPGAGDAD